MIRRKKESKRIFFAALFIITIFISNVQILNNLNQFPDEKLNDPYDDIASEELLKISDLDLDDNIIGSGENQDVRIYAINESINLQDNEKYFEIPSIASNDMFLTSGDFNFTFQNNFTTDHVIEDDDALYAADFISFDYDTDYSNITWDDPDTDKLSGWFHDNLIDDSNSTFIQFNATQGVINFTISSNFTDTLYSSAAINGEVEFNRTKILGLIFSLIFRINRNANLTIKVKDYSQSDWKEIISSLPIDNKSLSIQEIKRNIINENLNFTDLTNMTYLEFIFERFDKEPFYAWLHQYDMQSTYAFDLPITNETYVALEFDLKGEESAVNGFYAWIRTLDLAEAATTQLNITLYRANGTVVRTDTNLRSIELEPDYNDMIDTYLVNYTGDKLSYFAFNTSKIGNLNLSNYFIVIKSNNSKEVYSLVTLPWLNYGDDGNTEHQLKTTNDDGGNWINAKKIITTTDQPYDSRQLDASSFKLNVTRGFMPSDFVGSDNITTLRIQNLTLVNRIVKSYPYNESSYLTWGLGRWNHNFTTFIEDNAANNFQVNLTWNTTISYSFKFNVTYSVDAYWVENATATYDVMYNQDPEWTLQYSLDKNHQYFDNWTFNEFWFVIPKYMVAHNLTNPNSDEILNLTGGQTILNDKPNMQKIIINTTLANLDGFYTLNLTSFNFIKNMQSYINYNGTLWESRGFMYGDNISISVNIQDQDFNAPKNGYVNVSLYYPNGTKYSGVEINNFAAGYIDSSTLKFDFDNQTILDITNDIEVLGEYHLGFLWFNGSAISSKEIVLYIDTYDIDLYGCDYDPVLKSNVLDGEIKNDVYDNFTLLIASVNETTGIERPNFYPINNSDLTEQFTYEIGGQQLPVLMTSFEQSENILNPSEIVNIRSSIQNLHSFIPFNVKIQLRIVSMVNEEWIIAENVSSSILLNFSGSPDDSYDFNINLKIPDLDSTTQIWSGVNAPVRLAGAKTILTVFIEDETAGTYESAEKSLLSNKTSSEYEGHILGLRTSEETDKLSIIYKFLREECIYLPNKTSILINIFDRNHVSSYNQFEKEFTLKMNSKFTNITFTPNNPIEGHKFTLSAILSTEFGDILTNEEISFDYYHDNSWNHITSDFTDSNGTITLLINSFYLQFEEDLLFKLEWDGNSINGISRNISLSLIPEVNSLSMSIVNNEVHLYKNKASTFTVSFTNAGDSILRITDITIELNYNLTYSIVERNYILQNWLVPGERTHMILEMKIGNINTLEMNITVTALNIVTNESVLVTREISLLVYGNPISDYFIEFFAILILVALAFIWIGAVLYSRKITKRIQTPIEEEVPKKPKRGKYVPVSELKKPAPEKKIAKKAETHKNLEPKKEMDLDSLLEERGLDDKKIKKSKK